MFSLSTNYPAYKKQIILFIFFSCLRYVGCAQQAPRFSQYPYVNYLLNPAMSGTKPYSEFKAGTRAQWAGVQGAPGTSFLSFNSKRLGKSYKNAPSFYKDHSIGALIMSDSNTLISDIYLSVSYAYHMQITESLVLSTGMSIGFIQSTFNRKNVTVTNPNDPLIARIQDRMRPDLSLGFWLYSPNFYVGISGLNLLESGEQADELISYPRHAFVTGAYMLKTKNFDIIPSVLLYAVPNLDVLSYQADANLLVKTGNINFGASYRQLSDIVVMFGVNFYQKKFMVSYSYDYSNLTNNIQKGSHELVLTYRIIESTKMPCPSIDFF